MSCSDDGSSSHAMKYVGRAIFPFSLFQPSSSPTPPPPHTPHPFNKERTEDKRLWALTKYYQSKVIVARSGGMASMEIVRADTQDVKRNDSIIQHEIRYRDYRLFVIDIRFVKKK